MSIVKTIENATLTCKNAKCKSDLNNAIGRLGDVRDQSLSSYLSIYQSLSIYV